MTENSKIEAPERIWLQDGGDYTGAADALADLTWCREPINDRDTEYRRADLPPTLAEAMTVPEVRARLSAPTGTGHRTFRRGRWARLRPGRIGDE